MICNQTKLTGTLIFILLSATCLPLVASLSPPKGTAARPLDKKKVVVLGSGGSMGALTLGFVQRACSLYGTGLGDYRALSASADSAARLNSFLSKNFCLAFANEANIKLTDLQSVDAIQSRLVGWDALIFGTDMATQKRKVTQGTYEKTPNDICDELYWKTPSNFIRETEKEAPIVMRMIGNILEAAKQAKMKHILFVDESDGYYFTELVEKTGIPYTRIQPAGDLVPLPNYTYRNGVQGDLVVIRTTDDDAVSSSNAYGGRCYQEDIAALSVQCLLSLDWNQSRNLCVSTSGPATLTGLKNTKRPDQEWCVNSVLLEQALSSIQ